MAWPGSRGFGPAWSGFGPLWWENIVYAGQNDEKWLKCFMCIACSKATAFWPGFGPSECKAGPKAISGQHFGLALALVPKPKSRGFLTSGQSQSITIRASEFESQFPDKTAAGTNELSQLERQMREHHGRRWDQEKAVFQPSHALTRVAYNRQA
ncbi:hypothetical protein DFH09DRAFT_1070333 [Mycena vulgaris]|nr:hypothetical protein DFH09DRAFT_1086973 [Mycena vulgaris]KAJ6600545.1 hypothetical protein DFH09DRAFT_1070333 [Mycena vulgaris]